MSRRCQLLEVIGASLVQDFISLVDCLVAAIACSTRTESTQYFSVVQVRGRVRTSHVQHPRIKHTGTLCDVVNILELHVALLCVGLEYDRGGVLPTVNSGESISREEAPRLSEWPVI